MIDISKFDRDESRRSVLKKGALATASAGIIGAGTGSVAAQTGDGEEGGEASGQKALVFQNNFRPRARFAFVSDSVDWVPNVEEVTDNIWSNYQTRMIRYLNTGERVPIFVARAAQIGQYDDDYGFVADEDDDPNQPQVYEMDRNFALWQESGQLVTVNFSPVPEEEEDDLLDNEDWWQDTGAAGEGTATPDGTATDGNATDGNQTG